MHNIYVAGVPRKMYLCSAFVLSKSLAYILNQSFFIIHLISWTMCVITQILTRRLTVTLL